MGLDQLRRRASQLQLINDRGAFCPTLGSWIRDERLEGKGFDYSVVTVLGCQSSGKSTLLNELFETTFEVMDAKLGTRQTTRGLWLSKNVSGEETTLIIDVEGTDSKERGEDGQKFERRAALFSLAVADVVLINIWFTDLGRYRGSNYELLKTVLGANLELFQQQESPPKTILLFVIRDCSETTTPMEIIMKRLRDDIMTIWTGLAKPRHLKSSTPDRFFILKTVGLPSYSLCPGRFRAETAKLRDILKRECRPEVYSRQVPADGFAYYAKSVWDTILSSSQLDIPSQREALALYRCEELKNAARERVREELRLYSNSARNSTAMKHDFTWVTKAVTRAVDAYDAKASRYLRRVALKKREELVQLLRAEINIVRDASLIEARQSLLAESRKALHLICASESSSIEERLKSWAAFNDASSRVLLESQRRYHETIANLSLRCLSEEDGSEPVMKLGSHVTEESFKKALECGLAQVREKELGHFQMAVSELSVGALKNIARHWDYEELTPEIFWRGVSGDVSRAIDHLSESARKAFYGLQSSGNATEAKWRTLAVRIVVDRLLALMQFYLESLDIHICARFQKLFVQMGQRLSSGGFEAAYSRAIQAALVLPRLFRRIRITCPEVTSDPILAEYLARKQLLPEDKEGVAVAKAKQKMLEYKIMVKKGVVTTGFFEFIPTVVAAVVAAIPAIIPILKSTL